ncbi:MAG: condensation domain-containing protein [Mycobacteriaceae bacterium]
MVAIGSIKAWKPGRGPVTTWTASSATLAHMAQAGRDPLPASFQQESHLLSAYRAKQLGTEGPRLIMTAWDIDGWCDVAAMTEAINTHVRRHDAYHSAFDVTADSVVRRTIDDPERIEFVPTVMGFMEADEVRAHVATQTPGTLEWDCFTFGVIQKEDHFTFYANIDHLYTDGSSAVVIYNDIDSTYKALVGKTANRLPKAGDYRDFTSRQRMQVSAMTADSRPVKDWVDFARETDGNMPTFPLSLGSYESNAGGVVTIELLNGAETQAFDTACRAAGARFSGGVMACAALADHRLTGEESFHVYTPSDMRAVEAGSVTAGWYASLFPVSVDTANTDFAQAAREAQKSFDANKHLSVIPMRKALDLVSEEELGVTIASRPSMMVSLMDMRKLTDADASNMGIYIDNLNYGDVNMWVTRNADQTIVTVSFPDNAQARRSVHHYLGVLRAAFTDAAKLTTDWEDEIAGRGYAHSAQLAG